MYQPSKIEVTMCALIGYSESDAGIPMPCEVASALVNFTIARPRESARESLWGYLLALYDGDYEEVRTSLLHLSRDLRAWNYYATVANGLRN